MCEFIRSGQSPPRRRTGAPWGGARWDDLAHELHDARRQIRELAKASGRRAPAVEPELAPTPERFSSKGLTSFRRRLGLSVHAFGLLIGSSSQSVYNWEDGKTRAQAKYLAAIAFVKTKSKTQIAARLRELQT